MQFRACLIIILFLGVLDSFAQFGFTLREEEKRVDIPFEEHSNLIVVPLILNNRLPLKFILDTGVRNAILTEKTYSDMLDITYDRKYTVRGAGGEKLVDAYVASNIALALPGVYGKGHAMLVLDKDYIELRNFLGTEVHGMLGYELFSRFVIKIDYSKNIISLINPQHFKPRRWYSVLDLTVEDTKPYLILPVKFQDGTVIQAKLLIDTGASHSLMLDPQSGDSIRVPENVLDAHIGRGLGGKIDGRIGRVSSISFGKYVLEDALATFPYPNSYTDSLTYSSTFRNGTIGGDVLRRFNMILDYNNGKIYIRKNASFNKKFFYNMSGVTIKALGAGLKDFRLDEVREGSEAWKAGARSGDRLISVNGVATEFLDLKTINGFFNSRPGKRIRLTVTRKGEKKVFKFRLANPI